jgi:hypothetical protein
MQYNTLNQFDVVRLVHTKNIKYLSGPNGRATAPKGDWTVVGFVDSDCILAKQSTIVRVPPSDVILIASYSMQTFDKKLFEVGNANLDVVQVVSKMFEISSEKAIELCKRHKIPLKVESRVYVDKALKKLAEILKPENEDGKRKE